MSNYTKTTNFAAKDSLPSGNAAKIVKGTEIDTEFNNIETASATKADSNNSTLTGTTAFETLSDGSISITAFVDEDNMASDSATLLPTQQSVKAYVDSQVTAQDLDFQADTGGALSIDLDSETLTFTGGTGIDTSGALNAVTFAIDSTVATLTGSQTLSNKTLSTPVVSGNLTTDGLIDGRDVATDGTKLDGIESGATADQTAAEIKTAYESNADTNAFTDADHSKLDGIEASADVTDTANVTAAGALMDSELTSEASVKAMNQGVATTDSPTFAGVTAPITGNVTGNLTGNVTGNLTGDVTGDVTGNVTGNLTGSVLTAAQTSITSVGTLGSLTVSGDVTVDTNSLKVDSTNNRVGILNASPDVSLDIGSATDAVHVPVGTTAQRPTGAAGYFRYNSSLAQFEGYTDAWGAIGGGGGSNLVVDTMTGDGSDTTLTLSNDPLNENNTQVYIDGVYQNKDTYSVSGTTLTFSTAPPSGSAVEAMTIQPTAVNIPADASVTSAKLSGDLVTPGALDVTNGLTVDTTTLVVDATNNRVGIGTSSPTRALSVFGDSAGVISITSNSTDGISSLAFGDAADDNAGRVNYLNASNSMVFYTDGAERMRIKANGSVGIGTSSPQAAKFSGTASGILELAGTKPVINIHETDVTDAELYMGMSGGSAVIGTTGNGQLIFQTGTSSTSTAALIDSSGNLLVGKTSASTNTVGVEARADGTFAAVKSGGGAAVFGRNTNDGTIVTFRKDGSSVGKVVSRSGVVSSFVFDPRSNGSGLSGGTKQIQPANESGAVVDNSIDIGSSSTRFDDIFATNGTIQTSDRNEKQDIEALSDAEQRVAVAAKGLLRKFRWISSVEENGDDARIHFGIIAQDLQDAFTAEGLDAGRYAMFINSTWTDEDTGEERSRMGVRYSELLAFIISAI